jgi:hypothetical protein
MNRKSGKESRPQQEKDTAENKRNRNEIKLNFSDVCK